MNRTRAHECDSKEDDILRSVNMRKHIHYFFRPTERAPDQERKREFVRKDTEQASVLLYSRASILPREEGGVDLTVEC